MTILNYQHQNLVVWECASSFSMWASNFKKTIGLLKINLYVNPWDVALAVKYLTDRGSSLWQLRTLALFVMVGLCFEVHSLALWNYGLTEHLSPHANARYGKGRCWLVTATSEMTIGRSQDFDQTVSVTGERVWQVNSHLYSLNLYLRAMLPVNCVNRSQLILRKGWIKMTLFQVLFFYI